MAPIPAICRPAHIPAVIPPDMRMHSGRRWRIDGAIHDDAAGTGPAGPRPIANRQGPTMTTDPTPPRHSSPATSAPSRRSVAITLALAALLAFSLLLARPASAESLDWMPADDEIGFWGAKLPAPEGAHSWYIDYLNKDPQGHFTIFYAFNHNGREHYNTTTYPATNSFSNSHSRMKRKKMNTLRNSTLFVKQ